MFVPGVDVGFGLERMVWVEGMSSGASCPGKVAVDEDGSDGPVADSTEGFAGAPVPFPTGGCGDGSLRKNLLPLDFPALLVPFVEARLAFDKLPVLFSPSATAGVFSTSSGLVVGDVSLSFFGFFGSVG